MLFVSARHVHRRRARDRSALVVSVSASLGVTVHGVPTVQTLGSRPLIISSIISIPSASLADNSTQLSTNSAPAAKTIMSKIMIMIKNDRERLPTGEITNAARYRIPPQVNHGSCLKMRKCNRDQEFQGRFCQFAYQKIMTSALSPTLGGKINLWVLDLHAAMGHASRIAPRPRGRL